MTYMQSAIVFPEQYLPGEADNFSSCEVIFKGATFEEVWQNLIDTAAWQSFQTLYQDVQLDGSGSVLKKDMQWQYTMSGNRVQLQIVELDYQPEKQIGRLGWIGSFGEGENKMEGYHGWLVETLPGGRVRILTQETQVGKLAKKFAETLPNPLMNAHYGWLVGLENKAKGQIQ